MRGWRCPSFCRIDQPADIDVCQRCGTRLVPVPQSPPDPIAGLVCLKRVTLPGGDYGFCLMPAGHDVRQPATACDAPCSPPPPPGSFGPRKR